MSLLSGNNVTSAEGPGGTSASDVGPTPREAARYLWVSFPRVWLEASMSPRRRIDAIAVVSPGEVRKPFLYGKNPYTHFFVPGRRGQFNPKRQEQLAEAYAAIQVDWQKATTHARGGARAGASTRIWSVPAIVVYTPRLRDTSKVVLMNLHLMRSRASAGGYEPAGWIARGLLVARTLPEYRRRYADGTPYSFRDPRKVDDALARLRSLEIVDYSLVERPEGSAYEFRFLEGWQDRLGPMPLMPAAEKVRPWIARRAHPAGHDPVLPRHQDERDNLSNGRHNSQDGPQILRNGQQIP